MKYHEPEYRWEPITIWVIYYPSWQEGGFGPQVEESRGAPWRLDRPFAGPFKTKKAAHLYLDNGGKPMAMAKETSCSQS